MDVQGGAQSGGPASAAEAVVGAVGVATTAGCAVGAGGQPAPAAQARGWPSAKDQNDYAVGYDTVADPRSGEVLFDKGCASL